MRGWPWSVALGQRVSTGGGRMVVPNTPHGTHPVVPRRAGQLIRTPHLGMARYHIPSPGEMHRSDRLHRPLTPGFALGQPQGVPCRGRRGTVPQASGLRGRGTGCSPRRITLYGPAGGFQVVVGCAGWLCVGVLALVSCGSIGAWWLSRRCCTHPVWRARGKAIHR